jgi:hypothetical protein
MTAAVATAAFVAAVVGNGGSVSGSDGDGVGDDSGGGGGIYTTSTYWGMK